MSFRYKKECLFIVIVFILATSTVLIIRQKFLSVKDRNITSQVASYKNEHYNKPNTQVATTKRVITTLEVPTTRVRVEEEIIKEEIDEIEIVDDGSIIYDGLTITELTNKLNKSLNSYLKDTGYYFAKYTKNTGIDPYLAVSIVLLETGCKWKCSSLTTSCNNIGGLKGGTSCNGSSYSKYDTLEEGINGYLDIIYNNYYLKGMKTAEQMANKYATSSKWAYKVNKYIEEVKSK